MKKLLILSFLLISVNCSTNRDRRSLNDVSITKGTKTRLLALKETTKEFSYTCFHENVSYPCFTDTDGDSLLWAGLSCFGGEEGHCEAVKASQDEFGKLWRSPARVHNQFINSSSRDMLLGFLAYVIKTKDTERLKKLVSYVKEHDFKLCSDADNDRCNMNPLIYRNTWGLLYEIYLYLGLDPDNYMKQASIGDDTLLLTGANGVPVGFNMHLLGVELLLRKAMYSSDTLDKTADIISNRQNINPFFYYLSKGKKESTALRVYELCPKEDTTNKEDWAWQRDQEDKKWESESLGWDCIFMINLLTK